MPKRFNNSKSRSTKSKRRKYVPKRKAKPRRRRRTAGRIPRAMRALMPREAKIKFRYVDNEFFSSSPTYSAGPLNSPSYRVYRANGLYDPRYDVGASQNQPQGFDQWRTWYNRYVVTSAVITMRPCYQTATTVAPQIFYITASDYAPTLATDFPGDELELVSLNQGVIQNASATDSYRSQLRRTTNMLSPDYRVPLRTRTAKLGMSIKKMEDCKDIKDKLGELSASMIGVPTKEFFFTVVGQKPGVIDAATTPGTQIYSISIEYTAILYDRKTIIDDAQAVA